MELVVPAARHLVFGLGLDPFWARHAHGSNTTEISNYLGLLTFALAIGWLVVVYRRRAALGRTRLVEVSAGLMTAFVVTFLFIAEYIIIVIAFFSILFTRKWPRSMFDFTVGIMRWRTRANAYGYFWMTEQYPPFSLD